MDITTNIDLGGIFNQTWPTLVSIFWVLLPVVVTIILFKVAWKLWVYYVQLTWLTKIKWNLIEVKIPKDVFKSPAAMELILTKTMQFSNPGNWYLKYWEGNVRLWASLEIVSLGGEIHFYIRYPKSGITDYRTLEAQIYAQYPQAEITEAEDYTDLSKVGFKQGDIAIWGCEFKLAKDSIYPIKTYVDYGLDRSSGLDEEQKIDPITSLLEFMGSINSEEQIWFQIMIMPTSKKMEAEGKAEVKKLKEEYKKAAASDNKDEKVSNILQMTMKEKDVIDAIERHTSKVNFDCGMRAIYLVNTQTSKFNAFHISGLLGMLRQYNSEFLNAFKPTNGTGVDIDWYQDPTGWRRDKFKKELFNAYRLRSFFYTPHKKVQVAFRKIERIPMVLNTEELATIYHFPGKVSETPSFKRIEYKKSEPPANLPI